MFKRFTCFVLSLVLLLALLPAGAVKAEAASHTTSKNAITILKAVVKHSATCNTNGYIGYGTKCPNVGPHGGHTILESENSEALKKEIAALDTVLNNFASNNGISLSQNQHDALVLFTFRNGKAWMNGGDDLRTAVLQGLKGNEFLNRMVNWEGGYKTENDRKVLANMYLNNKYNSTAPANYVKVIYNLNGGKLSNGYNGSAGYSYYYDKNLDESALMVPTKSGNRFAGWLSTDGERTTLVTSIPKDGTNLYASWQLDSVDKKLGTSFGTGKNLDSAKLYSKTTYKEVGGTAEKHTVGGTVFANNWYVDGNGMEWILIDYAEKLDGKSKGNLSDRRWLKWRGIKPGAAKADTSSGSSSDLVTADRVKVTVTNAYINVREKPSIFATQVGTVYQGDVLRITKTKEDGGYLWGRYVDASYQEVGYVALMYTNYNDLMNGNYGEDSSVVVVQPETVVAKAVINAKAYVNVRDEAGTYNTNIISSLRNGTEVDLYETKYVNGQQWGRCKAGWFSLAYADVNRLKSESTGADIGFRSYMFTATIKTLNGNIYLAPDGGSFDSKLAEINAEREKNKKDKFEDGDTFTITNITLDVNGVTWGRISELGGWVKLSTSTTDGWGNINVTLLTNESGSNVTWSDVKFTTILETSVREQPHNNANRKDKLEVGTEVKIKGLYADQETIWGYGDFTDENNATYTGWVNLSTKYFSRNGVTLETPKTESDAGKIYTLGTIINAPDVNVRSAANIWGTQVGTLPNGTTVIIKDGPVNGTRMTGWYQLDVKNERGTESWVRGDYLDIFKGTADQVTYNKKPTSPDGTQAATGRGIVANTNGGVNVRVAPGTANAKVTKLLPGTEVTILSVTYHGDTQWGQIDQGWVCMDYIAMMDYDDLPGETTTTTTTTTTKAVYTGKAAKDLKVYKDTKTIDSNFVRDIDSGDAVTVYEIQVVEEVTVETDTEKTVKKFTWARVNDGYILLVDNSELTMDTLDEQVYTVTETDVLKVREDPGTNNPREDFDLMKWDQVRVTKIKIADANFWGLIEHQELTGNNGWICLAYCTKGAHSEPTEDEGTNEDTTPDNPAAQPMPMSTGNTGTGTTYAGTIIGSAQVQEVNVRKDATTNSAEVTTLKKGTAITITETKLVDGRSWGYCGSGWINLMYVDLTPVGITAIDAKIISVDNTLVYESYETNAKVVGSYTNRAVVHIYSEMNGMYETDMGWVAKGFFLN